MTPHEHMGKAVGIIETFRSGDCYLGDPSDGSHGGRNSRWCCHCGRLHCENHAVISEG